MIETEVVRINVPMNSSTRVLVLKEVHGQRHLPIWIGAFESNQIELGMDGDEPPRPMQYDLLKSAITELGGSVRRVMIVDLSHDVYFARIVVSDGSREIEIDARASDAIALAVRVDVPIMVEETVMDKAGVSVPDGPDEHVNLDQTLPEEAIAQISTEEDERLSVFRDFVNTLDGEEFEKGSEN